MDNRFCDVRYFSLSLKRMHATAIDFFWVSWPGVTKEKDALLEWIKATYPVTEYELSGSRDLFEWNLVFPFDVNNQNLLIFKLRWDGENSFVV